MNVRKFATAALLVVLTGFTSACAVYEAPPPRRVAYVQPAPVYVVPARPYHHHHYW